VPVAAISALSKPAACSCACVSTCELPAQVRAQAMQSAVLAVRARSTSATSPRPERPPVPGAGNACRQNDEETTVSSDEETTVSSKEPQMHGTTRDATMDTTLPLDEGASAPPRRLLLPALDSRNDAISHTTEQPQLTPRSQSKRVMFASDVAADGAPAEAKPYSDGPSPPKLRSPPKLVAQSAAADAADGTPAEDETMQRPRSTSRTRSLGRIASPRTPNAVQSAPDMPQSASPGPRRQSSLVRAQSEFRLRPRMEEAEIELQEIMAWLQEADYRRAKSTISCHPVSADEKCAALSSSDLEAIQGMFLAGAGMGGGFPRDKFKCILQQSAGCNAVCRRPGVCPTCVGLRRYPSRHVHSVHRSAKVCATRFSTSCRRANACMTYSAYSLLSKPRNSDPPRLRVRADRRNAKADGVPQHTCHSARFRSSAVVLVCCAGRSAGQLCTALLSPKMGSPVPHICGVVCAHRITASCRGSGSRNTSTRS
jgi:hypothetical protein